MRLRQKGAAALARQLDREIGARRHVLVEQPTRGRTEHFLQARLATPSPQGAIVELRIAGHDGQRLLAA